VNVIKPTPNNEMTSNLKAITFSSGSDIQPGLSQGAAAKKKMGASSKNDPTPNRTMNRKFFICYTTPLDSRLRGLTGDRLTTFSGS
jgi:hypothetical protein